MNNNSITKQSNQKLQIFDYSKLNPETAVFLQDTLKVVKNIEKPDVLLLIEIGEYLLKAKDILGHGIFALWLNHEFKNDKRTAQRNIAVAKMFKSESLLGFNTSELAEKNIGKTIFYKLAEKHTPDSLRIEVLTRIIEGETFTEEEVVKMIAAREKLSDNNSTVNKNEKPSKDVEEEETKNDSLSYLTPSNDSLSFLPPLDSDDKDEKNTYQFTIGNKVLQPDGIEGIVERLEGDSRIGVTELNETLRYSLWETSELVLLEPILQDIQKFHAYQNDITVEELIVALKYCTTKVDLEVLRCYPEEIKQKAWKGLSEKEKVKLKDLKNRDI